MRLFRVLGMTIFALAALPSCSKQKGKVTNWITPPHTETFPIANTQLKNCRFKDQNPTYTYGATIVPNPIICDEGVATSVHVMNPTPLPAGIQFAMSQLSLVGSASERVTAAPYQFYVENEAGYVVLKMSLTVK